MTLAVEPDKETEGLEDEDDEEELEDDDEGEEDGAVPAFAGVLDAGVFTSGFCAITGIAAMDKHKNASRLRFRKIRGQYS